MGRRSREPHDPDGAVHLEISHHIAELADRLAAEGWTREEAEREAARRFGDVELHRGAMLREMTARRRTASRQEHAAAWLADVRYALRALRRRPTFVASVIATLAIGMAAAAVVFTILDPLLLRPLPYREPDRLVNVLQARPDGSSFPYLTGDRVRAWRDVADVLGPLAAYGQVAAVRTDGENPEALTAIAVSHEVDDVVGIVPAAGRTFTADDAAPGVRRAMLGHGYWKRLGGARSLVGSTIEIDGVAYDVVGVLPRDFKFPVVGMPADVWLAIGDDGAVGGLPLTRFEVVARLADGISTDMAQARLDVLARELDRTEPLNGAMRSSAGTPNQTLAAGAPATWRVVIESVDRWRGNPALVRGVWMVAAAVAIMLLVSLTNGVNLIVLRGAERTREMAVRRALGGSSARIVRQVVCEGILLGIASGIAAVLVASVAADRMAHALPAEFAFSSAFDFRVETRVLAFTFLIALGAGTVLGLVPAWRAVSPATRFSLLRNRGDTSRDRRMTLVLAGVEIALAMVLLAGAGLLGRSFVRLTRVDPGFDAEHVARMAVDLPERRYATPQARLAFFDRLEEALERIPDVEEATIAIGIPPRANFSYGVELRAEGEDVLAGSGEVLLTHVSARADFLRAVGGRLLSGRDLVPSDAGTDQVLVDDRLAGALWDGPAVGRRFRMDESGPLYTVVGIYAHMTMMGLDDRQSPYGIVFPMGLQSDGGYRSIAVRTRGDAQRVLLDMRAALRELDPALPVYELESARTSLSETIDQPRLLAGVMTALSAVALLLAAIGIYGVLAYAATRRRREMGIRMALGAAPSGVRALIVRQGVAVSLAGVVVGLGCATVMSRFAGSLLYGVQPGDPVTLTGAALVLLGVAIVASWLPARRATNVDPVDVLRAE